MARPDTTLEREAGEPAAKPASQANLARHRHLIDLHDPHVGARLAVLATLVLFFVVVLILVLLPISLASIADDLLGQSDSAIYLLNAQPAGAAADPNAERILMSVAVVQLDE